MVQALRDALSAGFKQLSFEQTSTALNLGPGGDVFEAKNFMKASCSNALLFSFDISLINALGRACTTGMDYGKLHFVRQKVMDYSGLSKLKIHMCVCISHTVATCGP